MNENKTTRILRLIGLLSGPKKYKLEELRERFGYSERTIYRDLETLKCAGFMVECVNGRYQFVKDDYGQRSLNRLLHFSDEEVTVLYQALQSVENNSISKEKLLKKMNVFYDIRLLQELAKNNEFIKVQDLSICIQQGRQARLVGYRSSNSNKVEDKLIEPFEFSPEYEYIWAYEPSSGLCKQYRIHRIEKVEVLPDRYRYRNLHHKPFVDIFRMAAPEMIDTVCISMSMKAYNLLLEECPQSATYIQKMPDDNTYVLEVPVADYKGVGRFVIGLLDEINIIGSNKFRNYVSIWIEKYRKKI